MNREKILQVADAIEKLHVNGNPIPDLGFNMAAWADQDKNYPDKSKHQCGTTACIAGWTVALEYDFSAAELYERSMSFIEDEARRILDLDIFQAGKLFFARNANCDMEYVTIPEAVQTLRHLAETGEVSWSRFTQSKEEEYEDYE